jgi:hypothetical protein
MARGTRSSKHGPPLTTMFGGDVLTVCRRICLRACITAPISECATQRVPKTLDQNRQQKPRHIDRGFVSAAQLRALKRWVLVQWK